MYSPGPGHADTSNDDRIAGWIIIGLSLLYLAVEALAAIGISVLLDYGVREPSDREAANAIKAFLAILFVASIVGAVANIVIGYHITKSRKWAFAAGFVLNAIIALANVGLTLALEDIATVGSIMIAVCCFLRLTGRVGRRPV
jgi:hypothetical protein